MIIMKSIRAPMPVSPMVTARQAGAYLVHINEVDTRDPKKKHSSKAACMLFSDVAA